ncbi:hypothetical protein D3C81_2016730 [compost metagenome]
MGMQEGLHRRQPLIQIQGPDKRLEYIRQKSRAESAAGHFLPFAQKHKIPKAQSNRMLHQRRLTHDGGPLFGQLTLRTIRILGVQKLRYRQFQNCIPKEFQPLIILAHHHPVLIYI